MVHQQLSFQQMQASRAIGPRGAMSDLMTRIARDRDNGAFQQLFETFGGRIKNYMLRHGVDHGTAEELSQEALLTVWRKAALYNPDKGSLSTWIFTIARNLHIDRIRKQTGWQELTSEIAEAIPSDDHTPDEIASIHERETRVQAALADLTLEQRQVVILSYIEGLSHSQIAEKLSLPLGTVKSRMRLAYQKVRAALEDLQ